MITFMNRKKTILTSVITNTQMRLFFITILLTLTGTKFCHRFRINLITDVIIFGGFKNNIVIAVFQILIGIKPYNLFRTYNVFFSIV